MAVQISGNDITVPRDGTFTRNVTIGGTLTYEDVTNIDSVGLITARTGIEIGARPGVAASISVDGNMIVSGISTFGGASAIAGNVTVGSGITLSPDGDVFTTGVSTFSSNVNIGVGTTGSVSITPDAAVKLSVVGTSEQDVVMITTGSVAGNGDTFANIRGDNRSGIRIRGGGSFDGGAIELGGGLRDTDPGIIKFETGTGSSVTERLRITKDGGVTVTLGSNNSDSFDIVGHASQGRSTLKLTAGNATSNAISSIRLSRSNGNQPLQLFIMHDEDHANIFNGVVGGMIKFHVNESGSSLVRNVMSDTGHFINCRGTTGRIAFGTSAGVLYSGMGRYDGAAQDVGLSLYATTNAGTTFVEHFRMTHNGTLQATDTSIGSLSDSRLKKNIADYSYDISKFKQFKPKTFDWINPEVHGDKTSVKGFTAQDIELIDSDWVEETFVSKDDPDFSLVSDTTTTNGAGETVGVSKTSKFGYKDAMYISVIQQLISRIETLEGS